jgi:hypothetical protein
MPGASKETASETVEVPGYEGHFARVDSYTIGFETYTDDQDLTPLLKGLPDDMCQCPHWGYVIKGKVTYHTADGDETYETGQAYYVAPGHTPEIHAGTEVVEFSPTDELEKTIAQVQKNIEAAG